MIQRTIMFGFVVRLIVTYDAGRAQYTLKRCLNICFKILLTTKEFYSDISLAVLWVASHATSYEVLSNQVFQGI